MQSHRKIKKMQEYDIGESVMEDGILTGVVEAIIEHPIKKGIAYMLLTTSDQGYTIYRGLMNCNASLSLTRNIPASVMIQFAEIIQGGEAPSVPRPDKKYPVVTDSGQDEEEPVEEEKPTSAPYFDFI